MSGAADGVGTAASLNTPAGVALDPTGGTALIADRDNHLVRQLDIPSGALTTFAGTVGVSGFADDQGLAATFNQPTGITIAHVGAFALLVS